MSPKPGQNTASTTLTSKPRNDAEDLYALLELWPTDERGRQAAEQIGPGAMLGWARAMAPELALWRALATLQTGWTAGSRALALSLLARSACVGRVSLRLARLGSGPGPIAVMTRRQLLGQDARDPPAGPDPRRAEGSAPPTPRAALDLTRDYALELCAELMHHFTRQAASGLTLDPAFDFALGFAPTSAADQTPRTSVPAGRCPVVSANPLATLEVVPADPARRRDVLTPRGSPSL